VTECPVFLTYQYKIKKRSNFLNKLSNKVNYVFNYCNEVSYKSIKTSGKRLSGFDLNNLTAGTSGILKLNAQTIQFICENYALKAKKSKKIKLKWRSSSGNKRALGWVPFKASGVKINGDSLIYMRKKIKFHKSREILGKVLSGSFSQDACGDWYVNFQCRVPPLPQAPNRFVGGDLGQKDSLVTSDGNVFQNTKPYAKYEEKLAKAQRYKKKKITNKIHRKIARIRKDSKHKISNAVTSKSRYIFLGNLKIKTGKSVNDAGHGMLKAFCGYKAIRRRGMCFLINESGTTITCNICLAKTGPQGKTGLAVREWTCGSCGQSHHRDTNSALNILRIGLNTLKTYNKLNISYNEGAFLL
jgi:transposase